MELTGILHDGAILLGHLAANFIRKDWELNTAWSWHTSVMLLNLNLFLLQPAFGVGSSSADRFVDGNAVRAKRICFTLSPPKIIYRTQVKLLWTCQCSWGSKVLVLAMTAVFLLARILSACAKQPRTQPVKKNFLHFRETGHFWKADATWRPGKAI